MHIDYFKKIKDTYGHAIGDEVLKRIATILSENIRVVDVLARWGGEEFVVLSPHMELDTVYHFAERLRKTMERLVFTQNISLTLSIGMTQFAKGETEHELLKRADDAQYRAKSEGRNNRQA